MRTDEKFRPERFTDPDLIRERELSDCKQDLYKLIWSSEELEKWQKDSEWIKEGEVPPKSPKEGLAEFIRDVIAIANAARQIGQPGYLLFGIKDQTNEIIGIEGQSTNPKISLATHSRKKINEENGRSFQRCTKEFVFPSLTVRYLYGEVNEKLVAYLEIRPDPTPEPYQVKQSLDEIKTPLHTGDCWVRRGESKERLTAEEKQYLYPWTLLPYIKPDQWKGYLHNLETYPTAKQIPGYQDLYATNHLTLTHEVEKFITSSLLLLIIQGQAGCGKTVFMQDLAHQTATNLLQEIERRETETEMNYLSFQNRVPLFFELGDFAIRPGESLGRELLNRTECRDLFETAYQPNEPERLFKDKGKRWLIILDAFDEMISESKTHVWSAIRQLVESHQNIKLILTVRAGEHIAELPKNAKRLTVAPLSKKQILDYLYTRIGLVEQEKIEEILVFLNSDDELWRHLRLPLFLETAANQFSGGAIEESFADEIDPFWDQPLPHSRQETDDADDTVDNMPVFDIAQTIAIFKEELVDQAYLSIEPTHNTEPPELQTAPIKMGVFLDKVFHRLWKHNLKKRPTSSDIDKIYENLGEMAAYTAEHQMILMRECEKYLQDGLYWVLDLGVLWKKETWISFPTLLSKTYFASFFLKNLLESNSPELCNPIRGSPDFWDRCLLFVADLTYEDISPLMRCIELLKGERTHG